MKVTLMPTLIGAQETIPKGLVKVLDDLEIRGDHSDCSTIKIGRNTQKFPGDLRSWMSLRF